MGTVNEPVRPPLTTTTSILPAMVVLGIAVATLAGFLLLNVLANPRVATTSTTVPIVLGGLAIDPHDQALHACDQGGSVPGNISGALLAPERSAPRGVAQTPNSGAGDYDCFRQMTTAASGAQVLGFYKSQLQARGWDLFSHGSASGGAQLLFQKAGSDTFYWVVGITINSSSSSRSIWTLRIYQNSSAI